MEVKAFEALPVTLKVKQRTTTTVPGSGGKLLLTVDDITRGQVMITLLGEDEAPLAGPVSAKPDQSISFRLGGAAYAARVAELSNTLVGDDFVTIVIDRPSSSAPATTAALIAKPELNDKEARLTDQEKIERLIAAVAAQHEAKFIRNGTAYTAQEAADHLRMKVENARRPVETVSDFIDNVASRSSITGKAYLMELPDGRTLTTGDFLRGELAKIERGADQPAE